MRRRRPARDLRTAIDSLPLATRRAMLVGVERNTIIVGAYTDGHGGVCPMLAAHRNGGRTSLASFAKAWDRYTGARRRARPATGHELTTLRAMLEASIMLEEVPELPPMPAETRRRVPFRRPNEYERALAELEAAAAASASISGGRVLAGADELDLRDEAVARGA